MLRLFETYRERADDIGDGGAAWNGGRSRRSRASLGDESKGAADLGADLALWVLVGWVASVGRRRRSSWSGGRLAIDWRSWGGGRRGTVCWHADGRRALSAVGWRCSAVGLEGGVGRASKGEGCELVLHCELRFVVVKKRVTVVGDRNNLVKTKGVDDERTERKKFGVYTCPRHGDGAVFNSCIDMTAKPGCQDSQQSCGSPVCAATAHRSLLKWSGRLLVNKAPTWPNYGVVDLCKTVIWPRCCSIRGKAYPGARQEPAVLPSNQFAARRGCCAQTPYRRVF